MMETRSSSSYANSVAYFNGRVFTSNEQFPWAEGFIVSDTGVFEFVGSDEEVLSRASKRHLVKFDLRQKFIMPGIHDAHSHMYVAGSKDLSEAGLALQKNDTQIAQKLVEGHCSCAYTGVRQDWVLGGAYLSMNFPDDTPDRVHLDQLWPDQPVLLREFSGHKILLNSVALKRLNIDDSIADPPGGSYVRREDGTLTGEVFESATDDVWRGLPIPPLAQVKRALSHAISICHRYGITSVQEASASTIHLHALRELESENRLDLDVYSHVMCAPGALVAEAEESLAALIDVAEGFRSKHLNPQFVKFMLDGTPLYDSRGMTCKIHATGQGSVRMALDVLEKVRALNEKGPRHEIAHCNSVHDDDVPRFAALNVTAEMSPAIFHIGMFEDMPHLGKWDFSGMLAANALVTIGSDWLVVPNPNLFPCVAGLAEEIGAQRSADDGLTNIQRGSRILLRIMTRSGAEAVGSQHRAGSIEVGKKANFIAVDRDLSEGHFSEASVLRTWFEGRVVYSARNDGVMSL
ncbi:hypothetical protein GQ53DRAFT_714130 [Thozetella sp. PMI_491]|nr:hypothetical protein GQ53DRAFT_714130 [Thozetella sp. PMI_491]